MDRFRAQDLRVESKVDLSPVSDADRAAEDVVRSQLRRTRPRDAVIGEEYEPTGSSSRQWVVDPIDGTRNYVRGVPVWATLIALIDNGHPVLGVVSAPALQRRWWGALGSGAYAGRSLSRNTRIHVSAVTDLSDASLSYSSLGGWQTHRGDYGGLDGFLDLAGRCARTRAFGDFWSYMLLAEGSVDIACEPELQLYDMAALVPIVTEAGGLFTSLDGQPGPFGGNALATNGYLHDAVLAVLTRSGNR
ncbi:MAG: histidinol phosphatase [Micrococcales bacterium]|nr:MAG: histidinol phosphatase [Micrococcales bacterium]PIE25957.1 MAG: histidinol phosphatase [Micrococcales bacterium]